MRVVARDLLYFLDEQIAEASNRFAKTAYQNVKKIIASQPSDFLVVSTRADGTPRRDPILSTLSLTSHMTEKLYVFAEQLATGQITVDTDKRARAEFFEEASKFLGVGPKLAATLFELGARNTSDLRKPQFIKHLPDQVQTQLKYGVPELIPYEAIQKLSKILESNSDPQARPTIVGSFRRKKPLLKDLDILLCAPTSDTSALLKYHQYLSDEFGDVPLLTRGKKKLSLLIPTGKKKKYMKADVFLTSPDSYFTQLFYSTGSKDFNIRVRKHAARQGLMVNQYGIWRGEEKLNSPSDDERRLCEIIGVEYLEPQDRVG